MIKPDLPQLLTERQGTLVSISRLALFCQPAGEPR